MQLSLLAASLGCIAQAIAFPNAFNELTPRSPSPKHIQNNLGPQLSKNASIYFPGSAQFADGASRWSTYDSPNISVVVEVANADDVSKTIQYANSVNMPFLAVSRGHGYANTLGKLKHGIEIWLTQLDTIEVAADGNSALIGGGVYIKQVIDALTPHKKVAGKLDAWKPHSILTCAQSEWSLWMCWTHGSRSWWRPWTSTRLLRSRL